MNVRAIYDQVNAKTRREYPQLTLHELIRQQCEQTPDAIAVVDHHSTQTYAQLNQRSDELAAWLKSDGVGPGDLVGLCCNRDVDTPALLIGIMKSGAGYVPLDPEYPADRLAYMADDADLKHVVAHSDQAPIVETFNLPTTFVDRDWDKVAAASRDADASADFRWPQAIFKTSPTSSTPLARPVCPKAFSFRMGRSSTC